jgi:predicted kinase
MKSGELRHYLIMGSFPSVIAQFRGVFRNSSGEYVNLKFFIHELDGTRHKRHKACQLKEWEELLTFLSMPSDKQISVCFSKNGGELRIGPLHDGNIQIEYSIKADARGRELKDTIWVSLDDIWQPFSADPIPGGRRKAVILIGIPATGKSTFFKRRFNGAYTLISRDILNTWNREQLLMNECFRWKESFVVDNTNVSIENRERFITPAKEAGYRIVGYYFSSRVEDALERNRQREGDARIPDKGVLGRAALLERPTKAEGFDELWYVRMDGNGSFIIEEWNDAV